MPRANRYFLPGHIWHITHRCHKKELLLKFAKDRKRWLHWLFETRKRFGLCVLNYIITSKLKEGTVFHCAAQRFTASCILMNDERPDPKIFRTPTVI